MESAVIIGDPQFPQHDPAAVECAYQIAEDIKPDVAVLNGDWCDWRLVSVRYPARKERKDLVNNFNDETAIARSYLREFMLRAKPKRTKWNDGNHEWRLYRLFQTSPQLMEILGLDSIAKAVSISSIMQLDQYGIRHSGEYPNGCWLFDTMPPGEKNIWVEHGFSTRKKAGMMSLALVDDRQCSVVVGHGERLGGPNWKKVVGNRRFFGIDGGNLSILAEPGKAEGIYSTVPHTAPNILNHQQGITVIYRDGNQYFPHTIPIFDGKAFFNGRMYDGHNPRVDSLGAVAADPKCQLYPSKPRKEQRKSGISRRRRRIQ